MDAFLYLRIRPGRVPAALSALSSLPVVRQAALCVGDWDVLARIDGPDLQTIASSVLADVHAIDGVVRTYTAPVVPADRIGIGGFGGLTAPPVTPNACYVHIQASPGAATGVAERLAESPDVAGVAVLGGHYDLIVCIPTPWEEAVSTIVDLIHDLPGVTSTNTLVAIDYEEPNEDRDQFSSWT